MAFQPTPRELLDAFGIGVYLLLGVFHFDLWRHRPERRSHLWLATASAGALAVDATGILLHRLAANPPAILVAMNLLGVGVATGGLIELVQSLVAARTPRVVRVMQLALLAAAPIAVIGDLPALGLLLLAGAGALLVYASTVALRAGRGGDAEARIVAAGLVVLIACLVIDVLMELRVVPKLSGLPILGFTILFLASTRALNTRFQREYRELVTLRLELEARVEARTRDLADLAERFAASSRTDELTDLPNRRGFVELAGRELERARRTGAPCAIVMVDVDHFKGINDAFGHAVGDAVLRGVASSIRESVRANDIVARWGGEEFVLLLPDTSLDGALLAAEKARAAIRAHELIHEGRGIPATASFGVAPHTPGRSLDAAVSDADRALYRAKEEGRDRVVVHQPE